MDFIRQALLGHTVADALHILRQNGYPKPSVVITHSPYTPRSNAEQYLRSEQGESSDYSESRVVRVNDDASQLTIARFITTIMQSERDNVHE